MGISVEIHKVALLSTVSRLNSWNLEMVVFVEGGKPENLVKNPWSKDENQQQTQAMSEIRTQAAAIPAPLVRHQVFYNMLQKLVHTSFRLK